MLPRLSSTSRSSHLSLLSAGIIAQATKPATPTVFPNWLFMWVFVDSWQKILLVNFSKVREGSCLALRRLGGGSKEACRAQCASGFLPGSSLSALAMFQAVDGQSSTVRRGISGARPLAGLWSLRRMRVMVSVNCQLDNIWTHPGDSSHASERVIAVQLAEVRRHGLKTGGAIPRVWALPRRACAHSVHSASWL